MNLLLSHVEDETRVASVLKEWIESSLDRDVHLRGEVPDVELGEQRLADVDRILGEAQVVLLLCSEQSIRRPWIIFESGCAWFKRVPVMALCHGACSPADLPAPLGSFPAFDLADAASCQGMLETLARHLRRERVPRIDGDLMVAELSAAMAPRDVPGSPPVSSPDSTTTELASDETTRAREIRLLAAMSHLPDFTCTAPGLATVLEEPESAIRETLEGLVGKNLLTLNVSTHPTDPETRYACTEQGEKYLAEHDRCLVDES